MDFLFGLRLGAAENLLCQSRIYFLHCGLLQTFKYGAALALRFLDLRRPRHILDDIRSDLAAGLFDDLPLIFNVLGVENQSRQPGIGSFPEVADGLGTFL